MIVHNVTEIMAARNLFRFATNRPTLVSAPSASASRLGRCSFYSTKIDPMTGELAPSPVSALDASQLQIEKTQTPRTRPPSDSLVFGASFSDHMLVIPWSSQSGWAKPQIKPYAPLTLDPSSVIFHYAPSLFEGMKAYKDKDGKCRLFRPDMNMRRMNLSADRLVLPVSCPADVEFNASFLFRILTRYLRSCLTRIDVRWTRTHNPHQEAGCSGLDLGPGRAWTLALHPTHPHRNTSCSRRQPDI